MTSQQASARTRKRSAIKAPRLGGTGEIELPGDVFGEPFHRAAVYEAARAEQLARRRGTAATKGRGAVRGGGSKPWRQKGTGRARAGSSRAPHWTGGGVAFGPTPRNYTVKVNRKARRRALRAALSVHAERGSVAVVDGAAFEEPSTKKAVELLEQWDSKRPVLVVLGQTEQASAKSFRNIERINVLAAEEAGVADVMAAASVVLSTAALEGLAERTAEPASEPGEA